MLGLLALACVLLAVGADAQVNLNTAASFGVLAVTTVTSSGSNVVGNVGYGTTFTFNGGSISGFNGTTDNAVVKTAFNDAYYAYQNATNRLYPMTNGNVAGTDVGALGPLKPGVYNFTTTANLNTILTLDGNGSANSVFIFNIGTTLTTTASVVLTNGAQASNVFWLLGTTATIGTNTMFVGNILAQTTITVNTGATVQGGLYATTTVTLNSNNITSQPTFAGPPPYPGVKGDPHFSGADGSHFDFTGRPNATFCLVTDAHLHVNAFFGGTDSPGASKAMTWIRRVGIFWGHHTIQLAAREGARWQYDNGYMASIEVDGEHVVLTQPGDTLTFPVTSHNIRLGENNVADNRMVINWLAAKEKSGDDLVDVYEVQVGSVMTMRITLRPEVAILRTPTCGMVHMSLEWSVLDVSERVHGVLGQTYRPDFKGRLSKQALQYSELLETEVVPGTNAEGFLDGDVDSYLSSSLMRPDCAESRFARANEVDSDTAKAREMSIIITKTFSKPSRKMWVNV